MTRLLSICNNSDSPDMKSLHDAQRRERNKKCTFVITHLMNLMNRQMNEWYCVGAREYLEHPARERFISLTAINTSLYSTDVDGRDCRSLIEYNARDFAWDLHVCKYLTFFWIIRPVFADIVIRDSRYIANERLRWNDGFDYRYRIICRHRYSCYHAILLSAISIYPHLKIAIYN